MSNAGHQHRESRKLKNRAKIFQTKEQDNLQKYAIVKQLYDLPDRKFKITVIKLVTKVKRTVHEQSEDFNRDRKCLKILNINGAEKHNN